MTVISSVRFRVDLFNVFDRNCYGMVRKRNEIFE